jgi:hypothetical protein
MFAFMSPARFAARAAVLAAGLALAAPAVADPALYEITPLVSDLEALAPTPPDPDLLNPWGVAFNPNGFVWVTDNHSGKSTLYDGNGVKQSLVVAIPSVDGTGTGSPTGITFNGTMPIAALVASALSVAVGLPWVMAGAACLYLVFGACGLRFAGGGIGQVVAESRAEFEALSVEPQPARH